MGSDQSHEKDAEEKQDETEKHQKPEDPEGSAESGESPAELPQCMMGNRRVDNMCFMISCTNWY